MHISCVLYITWWKPKKITRAYIFHSVKTLTLTLTACVKVNKCLRFHHRKFSLEIFWFLNNKHEHDSRKLMGTSCEKGTLQISIRYNY
jgi:hypothetical protein